MLITEEFEILINGLDKLTQEEIEQLLKHFNFENILNISITDFNSIRLHIEFLTKLSKMDIFYKNMHTVKYSWEFTLMNLLYLKNTMLQDMLYNLLDLLKCLISKMPAYNDFIRHVQNQKERVFNILAEIAKFSIFAKHHVSLYTEILTHLIDMDGPLLKSVSKNLVDIAVVYKDLQVVDDLIILSDISLNKFTLSSELADICIPWFLAQGPNLLAKTHDESILQLLLKLITDLLTKFSYCKDSDNWQNTNLINSFKEFVLNLKKESHQFVILAGNENFRDYSLKILSVLIAEFILQEMDVKQEQIVVHNELSQFPLDINQWPFAKLDIFYYVCNYLCTYNCRSVWTPCQILESLAELVYSYRRFTINKMMLKNLCFIYSFVIPDSASKNYLLLGDDLLLILSKFPHSFPKIITFHVAQLVWILRRGSPYIKKRLLAEWLRRDKDVDILAKVLTRCKVAHILLDIIVEWDLDEVASSKATEICHRIQDKDLQEKIALTIPLALHDEDTLNRLILSNPGIPDDIEVALQICEFMSLILCCLSNERVLKTACSYSKHLITNFKREDNILALFCRDIRNIQFLTIKVKYVEEETAIEILRLLKVLVLVQKRNHSVLETKIEANLLSTLMGSAYKIEKCLELLQILVIYDNVFIKLERSNVTETFTCLLDISRNTDLADKCFNCLTGILKSHPSLAQLNTTRLFIEVQCSLVADQKSGPQFLAFLAVWMKIMKDSIFQTPLYVPDKRIIESYIKRSDFITQSKVNRLLELLDQIHMLNSTIGMDFYQRFRKRLI